MSFSRYVVVAAVTSLTAIAGCGADSAGKEDLDVASTESDLKLSGTKYLGQIVSGQTRTAQYSSPPPYRAFGFEATGGDEIVADVKSHNGDAVAWLTDEKYNVLAFNDDASKSTLDAKVKYKVPAGQATRAYRIVFRDYDNLAAEFDVTLNIRSAAPPVVTCSYDGKQYKPGEQFDSTDGCNTCTCSESGAVGCTKMACACNPAKERNRAYRYTPQQCMVVRFTCPPGQRPFSNPCGCGCETVSP